MQRYKQIFHKLRKATFGRGKAAMVLLMLLLAAPALASVAAAQTSSRIVIGGGSMTVAQAFKKIEQQTGMRFAIVSGFNSSRVVTLPANRTSLGELMNILLRNTGFAYRTNGQFIIVDTVEEIRKQTIEAAPTPMPKPEVVAPTERTVVGLVMDANAGEPLAGADVSLAGQTTLQTKTDKSGYFTFDKITFGTYTVSASNEGYISAEREETIAQTGADTIVLLLHSTIADEIPLVTTDNSDQLISDCATTDWLDAHYFAAGKKNMPRFAVKTNALLVATTSPNLGFEMRIGKRSTIDLPVSYNNWTFRDNAKVKHLIIQPEYRYWSCEPFNKAFVGAHLLYAFYNVGRVELPLGMFPALRDKRYEGHLFGAGVSGGYNFFLAPRWSIETTFGFGYFYTQYKQFDCETCGRYRGMDQKHYFGPTKIGASLVFIIK